MEENINWLCEQAPWVRYRTRIDLLDRSRDNPEVKRDYEVMSNKAIKSYTLDERTQGNCLICTNFAIVSLLYPMKKIILSVAATVLITSCATTTKLQVQVTPLGEEPAEVQEQYTYALPMTVLKVEVICEEVKSVPGPYWEYAEKYLGITELIKQKSSHWQIHDVAITQHFELDPQHFYSLNVLEGELGGNFLDPYKEKGILVDGTEMVHEEVKGTGMKSDWNGKTLRYLDLGVYANLEERTETMYKTLVTDTSFVKVPVQRTVVEQKSHAMKAKEAADFLLEIRTRRFEMLTGEYEVYPDGEAMEAAINKLDQLEESYLTLFTGKTISRILKKAYFIVPEAGSSPSKYRLDMFSNQLGFIPAELMEGVSMEIQIEPMGKTVDPGNYFSRRSAGDPYNKLIYRLPDVVELKVMLGTELLSTQRLSIFQSGAVVTTPINE